MGEMVLKRGVKKIKVFRLSKPIKIVHLLYSGLGGHSAVFFSLYEASRSDLFQHVPFFAGIEPLNANSLDRCNDLSIPFRYFKKKKGIDFKFYRNIYKSLLLEQPDIVFLHGTAFVIPAAFYHLKKRHVKIVTRDTQSAVLKTKTEWMWLYFSYFIGKKNIFLTQEAQKSFQKKLPVLYSSSKTAIISNGINVNKYMVSDPVAGASINIGMQSRLQPNKDHRTLVKAFEQIVHLYPQYTVTLYIAGDGVTMAGIKQLVAELGLTDKVYFCGLLDETQLIAFMQNLNIYVHATFGETMSNSILQAMACGLPVIASDVWGVNNMIDDGANGVLYQSEDVADLTEKIRIFIEEPLMAKQFGLKARSDIENRYSSEKMCKSYENIFNEVINNESSSHH